MRRFPWNGPDRSGLVGMLVLLAAVGLAGCRSTSSTTPSQAPAACAPAIASDQMTHAVGFDAGTFTVPVTAADGCGWTASATGFLQITSGATGSGNGAVAVAYAANSGALRTGTATIAGATITVNQAAAPAPGCAFALSTTSITAPAAGNRVTVHVTVTQGTSCSWIATAGNAFVTIVSGASGSGDGDVVLSVGANTGSARTAAVVVAGQNVTVNQNAAAATPAACILKVTPSLIDITAAGGPATINVTVTQGTDCAWTALTNSAFVTVTSGASGTGAGIVSIAIANNSSVARTGTVTVAGVTVTVRQEPLPGAVAIFSFTSDAADFVGHGQSKNLTFVGAQQIHVVQAQFLPNSIQLDLTGFGEVWSADLSGPNGGPLAPGLYDSASRWPGSNGLPGLDISGNGSGCNWVSGRFLIGEVSFSNGSLMRLHAKFEQHCEFRSAALTGEVWYDVFGNPAVTPMGSLPAAPASPTTFLTTQSDPGDFVGGGQAASFSLSNAYFQPLPDPTGRHVGVSIGSAGGPFWQLDFAAPTGQALVPGTYANATRYPFSAPGVPGFSVSGNSRGCNSLTGSFQVLEVLFDPQGAVLRFHATFEQHCEGAAPALRGEIYVVANPWR